MCPRVVLSALILTLLAQKSAVDAANNIVVAIKDASGGNPLVLIYQMREFNMIELVVCPPGQEPMAFNYEKREYRE